MAQAPFTGDYTFYIRDAGKPKQRGSRVKGKSQKLYFSNLAEAEAALAAYARQRGWKRQEV